MMTDKNSSKNIKRFLCLSFAAAMLFSAFPAVAEDDFWDEPMKIDAAAKSQQKAVTDQEFNKVINFFNKKKKKQEEKKKPKGQPIGPQIPEGAAVPDSNSFKVTYEAYPTVMIPVTLVTEERVEIPPGFYRILSVKKDNDFYLNFYQGNSIIAKIRAINTGNDYNQKSLNYAKVMPVEGNRYMNVIYGDIDCNIEAQLEIKE